MEVAEEPLRVGLPLLLSLIPYPPGDNDPEKTQRIRITHFYYILLLEPPPKHSGDNGVWEEGVGGH